MGELLGEQDLRPGPKCLHDESNSKLRDLGINQTQSHRYQRIAGILEDEFENKFRLLLQLQFFNFLVCPIV